MKLFFMTVLTSLVTALLPISIAVAGEFREDAMCVSATPHASFPRISLQTDPTSPKRGILILYASDGWTQVYSGPLAQSPSALNFREDAKIITATFDKNAFTAVISFNGDKFLCDERSFGH